MPKLPSSNLGVYTLNLIGGNTQIADDYSHKINRIKNTTKLTFRFYNHTKTDLSPHPIPR